MLVDIVDVLRNRPATSDLARGASVLALQTTRPLYLVFEPGADHPKYVVEFASEPDARSLETLLTRLDQFAPSLAPQSVDTYQTNDPRIWAHVQTGTPGLPWFKLDRTFVTSDARQALMRRAVDAMLTLHRGIDACQEWHASVTPGTTLNRLIQSARTKRINLSERAWALLEQSSESLNSLGSFTWHFQHGDMCLNNMLIGDAQIGIVDFEEFGLTSMPLHDEIGLAISCRELLDPYSNWQGDDEALSVCVAPTLLRAPWLEDHVQSFVLVFYLWRILRSYGIPKRAVKLKRMTEYIEQHAQPGT